MTMKITALVAAAFLAIGILVGAAGVIVLRDVTTPDLSDHMGGQMAGMMTMMGGGSMIGGGSMMGGGSMSPQDHLSHHATPTPATSR